MKSINKWIIFSLIWLLPLPLLAENSLVGQSAPLINGKNARDFGLIKLSSLMKTVYREKNADGTYREINGQYVWQVKKNVVVINFFATYCIPCIKEIPTFNKIAQIYRDRNVKLIYVNVDAKMTLSKLRRLIIKYKISVPMMVPNQSDAVNKYQVYNLPRIVVIDQEQRIANLIVGFQEDFESQMTAIIDGLF